MMTPGGMQNVTIINESGLYSLILFDVCLLVYLNP